MLGMLWLAGRVARGLSGSAARGRQAPPPPPPRNNNGDVAGVVIFFLLFPVMLAIFASARSGHVSGKMVLYYIAGFIVLFWTVGFAVRAVRRSGSRRYIAAKYRPQPEPDTTAADWRYLADEVAHVTRKDRVRDLLAVPCPAPPGGCGVAEDHSCQGFSLPVAVLEGPDPLVLCHLGRMNEAMRLGYADPEDVTAQFDGEVPEGIEIPEVTATWQ